MVQISLKSERLVVYVSQFKYSLTML